MVKTIASADASLRATQLELELTDAAGSATAPPAPPPPTPTVSTRHPRPAVGIWTNRFGIVRNQFHRKPFANRTARSVVDRQYGFGFWYSADCPQGIHKERGACCIDGAASRWGEYAFVRPRPLDVTRNSILATPQPPELDLEADGNKVVKLPTTTDPYQTLRDPGFAEVLVPMEHEPTRGRRGLLEMLGGFPELRVTMLTGSLRFLEDLDLLRARIFIRPRDVHPNLTDICRGCVCALTSVTYQ